MPLYNAVINNTRLSPGCRVVVIGPGPIGLLCATMAKLAGAEVAVAGLELFQRNLFIHQGAFCAQVIQSVGKGFMGDGPFLQGYVDLVIHMRQEVKRGPVGLWGFGGGWGQRAAGQLGVSGNFSGEMY